MNRHKIRLILVDDNPGFLKLVTQFLEQEDDLLIVGTASDSDGAFALATQCQPDVLLLDLRMPGTPWLEMIPIMRYSLLRTRIIVVSLMDSLVYQQAAKAVGAHEFVSKARLTEDLLPAIWKMTEENSSK